MGNQARNSNIELLRIVAMIAIISSHFLSGSSLSEIVMEDIWNKKAVFFILCSSFSKVAINCFVMITGYYMCKQKITVRKFLKLYGEIFFYRLIIGSAFVVMGYEEFSLVWAIKKTLPFYEVKNGFTSCFLAFWLFIPFLNTLVLNLNKKMHLLMLLLLTYIYVILATLSFVEGIGVNMNYFSWFIVVYITGAYLRLYPHRVIESAKLSFLISICLIIVSLISVMYGLWSISHDGVYSLKYSFWVKDCNKVLAYLLGISVFLFFKNIKIPNSRIINELAASTFGVLLIHAQSDSMRQWLWNETVNTERIYYSDHYMGGFFISITAVFLICSLIDFLRRKLIEKPLLNLYDKSKGIEGSG